MKMFLASAENAGFVKSVLAAGGTACLGSFYALQKHPERVRKYDQYGQLRDLFLDSGAFSAWMQGDPVSLDKYMAYIKANPRVTQYANMDVIGDHRATAANQAYMEERGLRPIPVFHMAAPQPPYELLDELCQRYEYIALGGVAGRNFRKADKLKHLDRCWSIITKHWTGGRRVRVHGFGLTLPVYLETYPWYSIDSASWVIEQRQGRLLKWNGRRMEYYNINIPEEAAVAGDVRFLNTDKQNYLHRLEYIARAYLDMAAQMTQLWVDRGVTWHD